MFKINFNITRQRKTSTYKYNISESRGMQVLVNIKSYGVHTCNQVSRAWRLYRRQSKKWDRNYMQVLFAGSSPSSCTLKACLLLDEASCIGVFSLLFSVAPWTKTCTSSFRDNESMAHLFSIQRLRGVNISPHWSRNQIVYFLLPVKFCRYNSNGAQHHLVVRICYNKAYK